jgi:2-haloalkanoic acid dehalogenase type II
MALDLTRYEALTFDCYGTLIDWEQGIATALDDWARKRNIALAPEVALALFGRHETAREHKMGNTLYRELLGHVLGDIAEELGAEADAGDRAAFGASVGQWPAFEDSTEALRRLQRHFMIGILSNVDRASFAHSNDRLAVEFDLVITAEDVGSYKPDLAHFHRGFETLAEMGVERGAILHVAQSLHHDHVPAKQLALPSVWINRRAARGGGWGATVPPPEDVAPDLEFVSLAAFADAVEAAFGSRGR